MEDRQEFTCGEVHGLTVRLLASVHEKISGLRKSEKVLVGMAAECSQGDVPDCPDLLLRTRIVISGWPAQSSDPSGGRRGRHNSQGVLYQEETT